jgi:hypothetical protein
MASPQAGMHNEEHPWTARSAAELAPYAFRDPMASCSPRPKRSTSTHAAALGRALVYRTLVGLRVRRRQAGRTAGPPELPGPTAE